MTGKHVLQDALGDLQIGKILFGEKMSGHASLKVGGRVDALVYIENENQLVEVVKRLGEKKIEYVPAGNLTNMIVRDGGYRGAIVLMTGIQEVVYEPASQTDHFLTAQAGATLNKVVSRSVAEELTGLEFCAGIPGSVGGAIWMNAGAYGKEMKDVVQEVYVLDASGAGRTLNRSEIAFGYRHTEFPEGTIVLGARFKLRKGERLKIKERINEIMQWRQEKHPLDYPSCGSIFKNLPGHPAGKIIEDMGLKGVSRGGAQISSKHANFIINKGNATASDVLFLIHLVQTRAQQEKNLRLETEVVIIGENE